MTKEIYLDNIVNGLLIRMVVNAFFIICFQSLSASIKKVATCLFVLISYKENITLKSSMFLVRIQYVFEIEQSIPV